MLQNWSKTARAADTPRETNKLERNNNGSPSIIKKNEEGGGAKAAGSGDSQAAVRLPRLPRSRPEVLRSLPGYVLLWGSLPEEALARAQEALQGADCSFPPNL